MAFINEVVSDRDADFYGLDAFKKEVDPWAWRDGRPSGFLYAWTIDRGRDIYFIPIKVIEEIGSSGRPEPTPKNICILNINGISIRIVIEREYCSSSFSDNPFIVRWGLGEINMPPALDMSMDEVVGVLKEALSVYGYRGAYSNRAQNVVVEFSF